MPDRSRCQDIPDNQQALAFAPLELHHQQGAEELSPDPGLSSFEPLFPASSIKLIGLMNARLAAEYCAKMLKVRRPNRIAAVVKEIADSGLSPWSVAILGGEKLAEKLRPLGVDPTRVKLLKKALHRVGSFRRHVCPTEGAIEALGDFPESPEALASLVSIASDTTHPWRCMALKTLKFFTPSVEALEALLAISTDPEGNVRCEATKSLGHFQGSSQALWRLVALLADDPYGMVHFYSGEALPSFHAHPEFLTALETASRTVAVSRRWIVIRLLARFPGNQEACATLVALSGDAEPQVREYVAWELARFPACPGALATLAALTTDADRKVRLTAIKALAAFPSCSIAFSVLENLAMDLDWQVREAVAEALKSYANSREAMNCLEQLLRDPEASVRISALSAIARLRPLP